MHRYLSLLIALCVIVCTAPAAWAFVFKLVTGSSSGVPMPSQSISSTSISCGSSCSGTAGTGSTVGTFSATLSPASPAFTGSWSLQTSGSVGATTCDNSGFFSVSGNSLNISSSATAATYNPCYVATQAGLGGSPFANVVSVAVGAAGTVACDVGPNASSVPKPAQNAGFTHCVLNADFTSSSTNNGVNFSNPNTWLWNCNTSNAMVAINNTSFGIDKEYYNTSFGGGAFDLAACNRAVIQSDPQTGDPQVLAVTSYNNSTDFPPYFLTEMHWPMSGPGGNGPCKSGVSAGSPQCAGGPPGTGLWQTGYIEITFRLDQNSFTGKNSYCVSDVCIYQILDFWNQGTDPLGNSSLAPPGSAKPSCELDFFETSSTSGLSGANHCSTGYAPTPGTFNVNFTDNSYHTFANLVTWLSGSNTYAWCEYVDGGISSGTPAASCVSDILQGTINFSGGSYNVGITLWLEACLFNGTRRGNDSAGQCSANPVIAYIKSIRYFACPDSGGNTVFTRQCSSPSLVTSDASPLKRYAADTIDTAKRFVVKFDDMIERTALWKSIRSNINDMIRMGAER